MATSETNIAETPIHLETSEILLQKLLVAIDFTKQSPRVLQEAVTIARCFGSEILLVHAASPLIYGTGMEPVPTAPFEMELEVAKAQMADLIANEPGLKELHHREFVEYGLPISLVRRVAQENQVELVLAGSHGASGLERLALGSVAESILDALPCPVLIIGPNCHKNSSPFRSILFATDLQTTGLRGAQFATSLAERFHAELTLLHVIEKKSRRFGVQSELEEDQVRHELTELLPEDLPTYTSATIRVEHGNASDLIPQIASSQCASLIVTGFGNHSVLSDHSLWSTLSQIIREAPCPVLTVRRHFI
jgi:nucleotide-binding universal stress UspA family protein